MSATVHVVRVTCLRDIGLAGYEKNCYPALFQPFTETPLVGVSQPESFGYTRSSQYCGFRQRWP